MKIVICIAGNDFSGEFLDNWSMFLVKCVTSGINIRLSRGVSPNLYYARNISLGGNILKGINQPIFDGEDYDYILFIDSDILFSFSHFETLLKENVPFISGLYPIDNQRFSAVKFMDDEYFKQHGSFSFLTLNDIKSENGIFEVAYTGLGFTLIKRGVIERLSYPWFRPTFFEMAGTDVADFTTEDVSLCLTLKQRGVKIFAHPQVIVGHKKSIVLY